MAIDLATRTVPGFFVAMERPSASTVALFLIRIVQTNDEWLAHLGLELDWPMQGFPDASIWTTPPNSRAASCARDAPNTASSSSTRRYTAPTTAATSSD